VNVYLHDLVRGHVRGRHGLSAFDCLSLFSYEVNSYVS
jgi:hypothetical protein